MACECIISGDSRFIWFDWDEDGDVFVYDTLLINNDITSTGILYKNTFDTGDRYVFKLSNLDFSFKNGQAFDNLSVYFIEHNGMDSLEYIYSKGFMTGYENADIQKKTDHEYLFKVTGQNIDSFKTISGSYPNAGIIFIDTEMLFRIKE
jgi:hypothetical protein